MAPHSTVNGAAGAAYNSSLVNDLLAQRPYEFLQPSQEVHSSILALSKSYLDPVAFDVSTNQADRLKEERKNKKRKRRDRGNEEEILRLRSLTIDGFNVEQVWAQAKRISAAVQVEVQRIAKLQAQAQQQLVADSDSEEDIPDDVDDGMLDANDDFDMVEDDAIESESDELDLNAAIDDYDGSSPDLSVNGESDSAPLVKDKFGLNDAFFSIDDFNRRTEMLEQQDFRGGPDLEAASDEEDLDYELDPMSANITQSSTKGAKRSKAHDLDPLHDEDDIDELDSEEDDDDEQGPTFGDMNLNAPEGASDDEDADADEIEPEDAAQSFMYKDFFEAPAGKTRSKKSQGDSRHRNATFDTTQPGGAQDFEADMQRAMSAVHKDIFSDEDDDEEEEVTQPQAASRKSKSENENLSSHEKRQADILTQIRQLEAKLVAKRPWVLAGEAKASDRPQNALLEEDLDFERTGKPLPVVTKETSEEIEELIKRRILAGEFDEVRKRRPGEELNSASSARRGRLLDQELDAPRQKGLAEVYEEDHLRKNDPAYVDKRTEKLKKEHAEIEAMWKDISHKLDSLASFRYRPKPADVTISVRSDAPAMSLEDARPSGAGGDVGSMDQLAPQEIYVPGEVKEKGKVVTKGGTVIDKAELSREERKRRRRREKERAKKAGAQKEAARTSNDNGNNANSSNKPSRVNERAQIAGDLEKGGVKIINRKGELRDVQGNDVKETVQRSAGSLRL